MRNGEIVINHVKKNRVMILAAILAVIATATVACSSSPNSAPGKGGGQNSGQIDAAAQIPGLLQSGITQADQEKWSAATTTFGKVLTINSSNVYANYDLGVIAQSTGNSAEAISYYNKALAADKAYTPAMYNEAILLESTQPQQAIDVYQNIVSINPNAATAYLRMAFIQADRNDLADAQANEAKAVSIDPSLGKYQLPAKQ